MPFPFDLYGFALFGAALTTALSLPLWRALCWRIGLVDDPGNRKIHSKPVPLAGGLAVATGMIVPLLLATLMVVAHAHGLAGFASAFGSNTLGTIEHGFFRRALELAAILLGALGMLAIGLWDDRVELKPGVKFAGQFLVALLVAASGARITLFIPNTFLHYAMTILWILTLVNAVNFMDNMNGLCAGVGTIGAWYFGLLAAAQGDYLVASLAFLITGALCGFLPWNYPSGRVFLGDAGSHLVGYWMAVLAILPHFYSHKNPNTLAVFIPLLVLAVPLGDLVAVVIIRWKLGKPFWIGDTNHLSHRMVRAGLSRERAVALIWMMAAATGALAFLF
jgi:UDP-GlcNAc:undecaprenyl-phosphate GlcNAc-1-phosphate transferase